MGTMPHALIGYAGSTVRAAEMFHETFPDEAMTVLVDYFGREVTDSLERLPRASPSSPPQGKLGVRLDTPGSRYRRGPRSAGLLRGAGAPCAGRRSAAIAARRSCAISSAPASRRPPSTTCATALNEAGFPKVRIVASSGFDPAKCKVMAEAKAPIDVIGTGSFLPQRWTETYATADIIEYDGVKRVKVGREFLFRK